MSSEKNFNEIRTGVIGVGSMGQNHARIYNELSNLVAVADTNEEQGRLVANRFGVTWYNDYSEMLDTVDAVSIAAPSSQHKEISEIVAERGINLLVEKPLSNSIEAARSILEASNNSDVTLAVGHVERFNPVVRYAKDCIEKGIWGDVITISAKRFSYYPERITDVGVIFDLSIHDLDILSFLMNERINSVKCFGNSFKKNEYEDNVIIAFDFENGRPGLCETSWLTPMKVREINICTTNRYVKLNLLEQSVKLVSSKHIGTSFHTPDQPQLEVDMPEVKIKKEEPLKAELLDFLTACISKTKPLVTGEDGLNAVIAVHSALDSLNNNRTTFVSQFYDK